MKEQLTDLWDATTAASQRHLNALGVWALDNPDLVFIITMSTIALLLLWGFISAMNRKKPQGEAEEMAQRKAYLDILYADIIGDALFELYHQGVVSRQEYKRDCRRIGVRCQLTDLLPRRNDSRAIAARVRKNVDRMKNELLRIQPRIPGPKPGEVVPLPPVKRVRMFLALGKPLKL